MHDAPIIILDEPTSGLDGANMRNVSQIIRKLAGMGRTILVITHDAECALSCCDRAIRLENGAITDDFPIHSVDILLDKLGIRAVAKEAFVILAHKEVLLWHRKKRARKKPVWLGVWNWHHNIRALFLSQAFLPQQRSVLFPTVSFYLFIMRELNRSFPDMANANMSVVLRYGWMALGGIAGNVILYFCALMCSHLAAFGTLYELKLAFANHITEIPLGYHLTIGSGRMRKIMDENIESIEKFIAHQFPDFVASLVAPLAW